MKTNTMQKKYSLVEWHDAGASVPDDDITVLIHDAEGDVVMGFLDGDDGWRYGATGERVTCAVMHWADVPSPLDAGMEKCGVSSEQVISEKNK